MSYIGTQVSGSDELLAKLSEMQKGSTSVAAATVSAGLNVLAKAAKEAAQGSIKEECGKFMRVRDGEATGRAGLIKFPRKGDGQNGPHGVYLERGTKFISARRTIASALKSAKPAAIATMRRAAEDKLEQMASQ
jgi:HK97 gp10 family phage protein